MRESQRSNSRGQPTSRVGNLNGRRRDVVPSSIGSSQPTPRVGNLVRRRPDVVDSVGSGLGTQQNETGSSQTTTLRSRQPSHQSPSPSPNEDNVQSRPSKGPRRTTIQTREFIEPEMEPDGQAHLETVRLSDDSSDEYQNRTTQRKLIWRRGSPAKPRTLQKVRHLGGVICHMQPTIAGRQCEFRPPPDHKR